MLCLCESIPAKKGFKRINCCRQIGTGVNVKHTLDKHRERQALKQMDDFKRVTVADNSLVVDATSATINSYL